MIWSNQEVLLACKLCPKHFTLNCIQMATEDLYCQRIGYHPLKEHVYKLIAKNEVFRIKRGLFALVENEDVISPTTLENIKRLKDELSEAKIKVEDAELQLCIARSHKALAEVAFIEAYQQIASKRREELKEQLGIDVLVLPAT